MGKSHNEVEDRCSVAGNVSNAVVLSYYVRRSVGKSQKEVENHSSVALNVSNADQLSN